MRYMMLCLLALIFCEGQACVSTAAPTIPGIDGAATNQSIHLLGMLTEAIQTPFMQDRCLSVENAKYVMNAIADFAKAQKIGDITK